MSDNVDKILTVTNVATITDLSTGELTNQVSFGHYIENTPEVQSRLPLPLRENFPGKQIGIAELILFIKTDVVVYRVGSKWHLKIDKEGTLILEALK